MKHRHGQVALYLALVLVGIALLMAMNVGIFLSVRAKNRATNAADAAVLAVAKHQGALLNRIGQANIDHLKAAVENREAECHALVLGQMRDTFLGPLEGVRLGSEAARRNGAVPDEEMSEIFLQHASDVCDLYAANPDLFPPPWDRVRDEVAEGCDWLTYADALRAALAVPPAAGPENAEFADEYECFPLLSKDFYEAAEGGNWCWFRAYGHEDLLDKDTHSMPRPFGRHRGTIWNCEVYPLHLRFASWQEAGVPFDTAWTNLVMSLTGCSEGDVAASTTLTNELQVWAFYDGHWRKWDEVSIVGNEANRGYGFPLLGELKREYDVKGCLAQCRVSLTYADWLADDTPRTLTYMPMAKPLGTVENERGEPDLVTACRRFVTPAFTEARLVPVARTGWLTPDTSDAVWRRHVQHLRNEERQTSCSYCRTLEKWDDPAHRLKGRKWLETHPCAVPGVGDEWGGAPYAY